MPVLALPYGSVIDVPTTRILARATAGTGPAEALTNTQLFAILGTGTPSASTYLRGDGTWSTVTAGISSLNGLTDATQTFAVGTTGTDVAFVSAAGTHTLNIPDASATARGLVTTGTQSIAGVKSFTAGEIRLSSDASTNYRIFQTGDEVRLENNLVANNSFWRIYTRGGLAITVRNSLWATVLIAHGGLGLGGGNVELFAPSSGLLEQRGSTAQISRLYNIYTSSTSFERLELSWAANVCTIEVTKGSAGGTLRGLKIGGASTSLLGFYGATPVDQPDTITDPTGGGTIDAEARTAISTIIDRLQELGLIA